MAAPAVPSAHGHPHPHARGHQWPPKYSSVPRRNIQILEGETHTTTETNEQTHKPSDTHETQSRSPTPPVLTENPHPRKHPARLSTHPHARRLIGRKGPEVARARPTRRRHARPRCDHRSVPSSDSASHAKTPLVLVSHALNISP